MMLDTTCVCGRICKTPNALRVHRQKCKRVQSGGNCKECKAGPFGSLPELRAHVKICSRTCKTCKKIFRMPCERKRHDKIHGPKISRTSLNFCGCCDKCKKVYKSKVLLLDHIKKCILWNSSFRRLVFATRQDFEQWLEKEQLKTNTYFSMHCGSILRNNGTYSYKYCQNNQGPVTSISLPTQRKTDRKRKCGLVPNFECSAKIAMKQTDGKIYVKYFSRHNHPCEDGMLQFQPFPKGQREEIEFKLLQGIAPKRIYSDFQSTKWNRNNRSSIEINKIDHISRRYINQRKSKMKAADHLHPDDATSTCLLVEQLSKEEHNPVLLYKPYQQNVVIGNHDFLSKHENYNEIFCLGLQTKEQAEKIREHGPKILCADATHGLTAYGYQLFSLVVKDDTGKGYPVGSLITSNVDKLILTHFLQLVQERSPEMKISVTMSDDDAATQGAFLAAFGADITNLLCHWHLPRAWKSNGYKIPNKDEKDEIIFLIILAMRTKDMTKFQQILHVLFNDYLHCNEFLDYFKKYYASRPEQWAACYRNFYHDGVDTNMLLESLHNLMKTVELERMVNRRVDTLVKLILKMEEKRFKDYVIEKSNGSDPPLQFSTKRHFDGLKISDSSVFKISDDLWEVASSKAPGVRYSVTRKVDFCQAPHCYLSCPATACDGLCFHLFRCSCPDVDPLCKHIHKVQSRKKRNMVSKVTARVAAAPVRPQPLATPVLKTTPPVVQQTVPPKVPQTVPPTVQQLGTLVQPSSSNSSDEEEKYDVRPIELLKLSIQNLHNLIEHIEVADTPKSIIEACNNKLKQCMQLLESGSRVKSLEKMQVISGVPKPTPNSRLERQPSFKKKAKTPSLSAKSSAVIKKAQLKIARIPVPVSAKPVLPVMAKPVPASNLVALQNVVSSAQQPIITTKLTPVPAAKPHHAVLSVQQPALLAQSVPLMQQLVTPMQNPVALVSQVAPAGNMCSKFAFIPTAPKHKGQLYGDLHPSDDLSKALFEINKLAINHIILKSLEAKTSVNDRHILEQHSQAANSRSFVSGWLIDTVIDVYFSIIFRSNPYIQFMLCSEVEGLHQFRSTPVRRSIGAALRLRPGVQKLLMPYNSGQHWSLLIYSVSSNEFLHLDSLYSTVPEKQIMEQMKICLEAWWGIDAKRATVRSVNCAQQTDGISCGIYVLHFAELCADNRPYTEQCNPNLFRQKVFKAIIKDPGNSK